MAENNGKKPEPKREMCFMRIAFPVTDGKLAMEKREMIKEILSDIPEALTDCRLSDFPEHMRNVL